MRQQRTKYIKVRMTLGEVLQFKEKAKSYGSMSNYVRSAVAEYSNVNASKNSNSFRNSVRSTESSSTSYPILAVT